MNNKMTRRVFSTLTLGALVAGVITIVPGGDAEAAKKGKNQCLSGEVRSMSKRAVTVRYGNGTKIINKAFGITAKQYDNAIGRNVRPGSQVKVCFKRGAHTLTRASLLGNILQRLAKKGAQNIEEAPGGENAGPGGGRGGGGS